MKLSELKTLKSAIEEYWFRTLGRSTHDCFEDDCERGTGLYQMSGGRVNVYGLVLRNRDVVAVAVSERQGGVGILEEQVNSPRLCAA